MIMKKRGRPRTIRAVDLKALTGPEMRSIISLMTEKFSPSDAYALQSDELGKAIAGDGGAIFKGLDLSQLNVDVFRDQAVLNYVNDLQGFILGRNPKRPGIPTITIETDDGELTAPAALKAYKERQKAAKAASKVVLKNEATTTKKTVVTAAKLPAGTVLSVNAPKIPQAPRKQPRPVLTPAAAKESDVRLTLLVDNLDEVTTRVRGLPAQLIKAMAPVAVSQVQDLATEVSELGVRMGYIENALLILVNNNYGLKDTPIKDIRAVPKAD
jgi:hypothetical protein